MNKKALLLILDGWGMGSAGDHNAIHLANPKFWNQLWQENPHSILDAKEKAVGLPVGCLSGSEVGHLILGAGRVVLQSAARIEQTILENKLSDLLALQKTGERLRAGATLHLIGLLSDGGIHSHIDHLRAFIKWGVEVGGDNIALHLFLDGRDMATQSAAGLLEKSIVPLLSDKVRIATICGRATAMDRSENWERTRTVYNLLTQNNNFVEKSVLEFIRENYVAGITDEFFAPARFTTDNIKENDAVIFFDFRADRMRQLVRMFTGRAPHNEQNQVEIPKNILLNSLTEYSEDFSEVAVLFPPDFPVNTIGEWVSKHGLQQLRIAETEKYAHVTYFFNGGEEKVFSGEERLIIPSLGLTNYASAPEMSLPELNKTLCRVLGEKKYDLVVCNIANGDMVGHSGDLNAAIQAVGEVDKALSEIVPLATENGYTVFITADHGNIEKMKEANEPHTAHTFNDVPLVVVGEKISLPEKGNLYQIAPTILKVMGLPVPEEMSEGL